MWSTDERVKERKVAYAHGKMTGNEIEDIMENFIEQKIDILVCTTILESGIDIPNADVLLRFLYQLLVGGCHYSQAQSRNSIAFGYTLYNYHIGI